MNLSTLILLPLLLAGQDAPLPDTSGWHAFPGWGDGSNLAVDMSSVKVDGSKRSFRARIDKTGEDRFAVLTMVADCTAVTLQPTDGDRYEHGKFAGHRPADPSHPMVMGAAEDPMVAKVVALVCTG